MRTKSDISIGIKIKQIRMIKGYTLLDIALATKTNRALINRLELGYKRGNDELLVDIMAFLWDGIFACASDTKDDFGA